MLYPNNMQCVLCDAELADSAVYGFCAECFSLLPQNSGKVCLCCGSTIENLADYCNRCQETAFEFEAARSSFVYDEPISKLIYGFKFGRKKYLAEHFGCFMADTLRNLWHGYDLVIPVPIHEKTLKKRNFNQAEELAREMCALLGNSNLLRTDLLLKTVFTPEQARLSGAERAKNLEDSFSVARKSVLKDKVVLLIDDILTTGATANECAKTLKNGGAAAVFVLTLASTKYKPILEQSDIETE